MKKVLITGASGFIGYNTVLEFVKRKCFVYAIINKSIRPELKELELQNLIKIIKIDLTNSKEINKRFKDIPVPDAIIHCAGRASDVGWEREFRKTNFDSVRYLTNIVKEYHVNKFVFISTTDVYGLKDFDGQTEEQLDYDKNPSNYYPKYKIKAERYIKNNLYKKNYCIIRPAAVYGEDDPTITKRVKDIMKISPFIFHFGKFKGKNIWPLANVKNVAFACYLGAFFPKAQGLAINVLDKQRITVDGFYKMIAKKYFPQKRFITIYLPLWVGRIIGSFISSISDLLNLNKPFMDPSLYAVYTISKNLDFSSKLFYDLKREFDLIKA
ncbi:MAG: NAD(P)-dependent oxidoreductase [Bacteroidetes bacterium]|nr:NAD(P)-dependent oxidoreductase [Bacteroidota bacterium]